MKTLPYSSESEQGLIGSMLIAPQEVMPDVVTGITAEAFYEPRHQTIFSLLVEFWSRQHPADLITATQALRERKQLDGIGGAAYITSLIDFTPTAANAKYYRLIVLEKHRLRQVIQVCQECETIAYLDNEDGFADVSERMQQLLTGLAKEASTGSGVATMAELVPDAVERLEARAEGKGKLRGIPSGLGLLDRLTNGWQGGQMIVVAAREKEGKSSLARQFALESAVVRDISTAIFSHEMSRHEIIDCLISTRARVDGRLLESGMISDADFAKIIRATGDLRNAPLYIFDEADSSVLQFRANARRAVTEHGCKLIIVDYLQLLGGSDDGKERQREERISEVGRNIKLAAKELDIPIIVLSQLNNEGVTLYARAIQQHLDKFIVIDHENPEAEGDGKAWLRVKLQRGGPKGNVPVTWRPSFTAFDALASED